MLAACVSSALQAVACAEPTLMFASITADGYALSLVFSGCRAPRRALQGNDWAVADAVGSFHDEWSKVSVEAIEGRARRQRYQVDRADRIRIANRRRHRAHALAPLFVVDGPAALAHLLQPVS